MTWDIDKAYRHLRKDPVMKDIIKATGKLETYHSKNLYESLLRAIASQQLSVKAAATIWERVQNLFPDRHPDPRVLLRIDTEQLRAAGLSYQKAGYMKEIARFAIEETLEYKRLYRKSDEELIEYLTQIKGVGRWTVEMLLIFSLNRPDVFPIDDLGIRDGMQLAFGFTGKGKDQYAAMQERALLWAPYRSLASRHLWAFKDAGR